MRAINHALTGAIIGLTVAQPVVALPLALASHFVLDALPHYGPKADSSQWIRSDLFKYMLYIDAILCFAVVLILFVNSPVNWLLAVSCAFLAAAPDLISFRRYKKTLGHKKWRPNTYEKFATKIQWFERPIGAVVEVVWLIAAIAILAPFLW